MKSHTDKSGIDQKWGTLLELGMRLPGRVALQIQTFPSGEKEPEGPHWSMGLWHLNKCLLLLLLLLHFGHNTRHVGSFFPNKGSNPCSLWWKSEIFSTGLPGKSTVVVVVVAVFNRWEKVWVSNPGKMPQNTGEPRCGDRCQDACPQPLLPGLPLLWQLHLPLQWTPRPTAPSPSPMSWAPVRGSLTTGCRGAKPPCSELQGPSTATKADPSPLCGLSWLPDRPSLCPWGSRDSDFPTSFPTRSFSFLLVGPQDLQRPPHIALPWPTQSLMMPVIQHALNGYPPKEFTVSQNPA